MNITELQQQAHDMALGKGWWPYPTDIHGKLRVPPDSIAAKLALVHSETSEALECVRDGDMMERVDQARDGKPEGLPSELADIVIRVADLCGALGIDLDEAIRTKMAYNKRRTHRHGGRAL